MRLGNQVFPFGGFGCLGGFARNNHDIQYRNLLPYFLQTTLAVLPLAPRFLAHHHNASGTMQQAHRAVGFVDVLTTLARSPECFEVALGEQIIVVFGQVDLGHDGEKMLYSF